MSGTASRPPAVGSVTVLTVHGSAGVLDLTVPTHATLADVAGAYAQEVGLPGPLPLVTPGGVPLQLTDEVADAGLVNGSVVVAVDPGARAMLPQRGVAGDAERAASPGAASATWLAVAVGVAVAAGWAATRLSYDARWPSAAVLLLAALVGALPVGALAAQRALAAPAFAAAGCFALAWEPGQEQLPVATGVAALGAAIAAGVGRALAPRDSPALEGLQVWMVVGASWFGVAALAVMTGVAPQVVWAVLFLLAVLAARFVPEVVVDVPDQYLLDLERLAVTAWSARERPRGRRGRIIVPEAAVSAVADRGTRLLGASAVAILVVVLVAAPLLLVTADLPLDRTGARCLVGFGGAALLLAARSHRHALSRRVLRLAGVWSLLVLGAALVGVGPAEAVWSEGRLAVLAIVAVAVAMLMVVVAVSVGRGWRSAWWSRRAEVAEALCGAFAVGSLVVAIGFFRHLWEVTG